jgi:hypothetical protein
MNLDFHRKSHFEIFGLLCFPQQGDQIRAIVCYEQVLKITEEKQNFGPFFSSVKDVH